MQVILVHGLGRTPLSMARLARCLRENGHTTESVGYVAALESFERIRTRIRARLLAHAPAASYAVVGHSLGGVLLRAALVDFPQSAPLPRLLVTLGTPTRPPRLASRLRSALLYRRLAGECGQLLADPAFLASLKAPPVPWTAIAGTRGWPRHVGPFRDAPNDGVVALDETAGDATEELRVPAFHTFLMNDRRVQRYICDRLDALAKQPVLG